MRAIVAALVLALVACAAPAPAPWQDRVAADGWRLGSFNVDGRAHDIGSVNLQSAVIDRPGSTLSLTLRDCNVLRLRWRLIDDDGFEAGMRSIEAVSTTGCEDGALDRAMLQGLRSLNRVRWQPAGVELTGGGARLVLVPRD